MISVAKAENFLLDGVSTLSLPSRRALDDDEDDGGDGDGDDDDDGDDDGDDDDDNDDDEDDDDPQLASIHAPDTNGRGTDLTQAGLAKK